MTLASTPRHELAILAYISSLSPAIGGATPAGPALVVNIIPTPPCTLQ
jgi:hypothetical protein